MPTIKPLLWFDDDAAEEAANYYVSIVKNSKIDSVSRYGDAGPKSSGSVMMVDFELDGQGFLALNGGQNAKPSSASLSRGAIALFVTCETQAELDHLWERLCDGGEVLHCGWLRDKYGFAWNVVPAGLGDVLGNPDSVKRERAMKAMLKMKKLDIDELRRAAESMAAL